MKTGRITAKLRDAVPVCLMVEGEEVARYKNIELPDALKEIEMKSFHFDEHMDGKIIFAIHYEQGALPEVFPEPRARQTRAAKAAKEETPVIPETLETSDSPEDMEATAEEATEPVESIEAPAEDTEAPGTMEIAFNLTGIPRKELVVAVSDFTGEEAEYMAAPSFAYKIGGYTVDKNGTLTGENNPVLAAALAEQGFTAAE